MIPLAIFVEGDAFDKPISISKGIVENGTCAENKLLPESEYELLINISTEISDAYGVYHEERTVLTLTLINDTPNSDIGIIIGSMFAVVFLIAVIIASFIFIHLHKRSKDKSRSEPVSFASKEGGEISGGFRRHSPQEPRQDQPRQDQLAAKKYRSNSPKVEVAVVASQRKPLLPRGKLVNQSQKARGFHSIDDLWKMVYPEQSIIPSTSSSPSKPSESTIKAEYQKIPDQLLFSYEIASRPENHKRNRFQDIPAYDHSRVILRPINEELDESLYTNVAQDSPANDPSFSDYINASWIHGYARENAFIASQGPRRSTVEQFWHMLWQENVKVIVMLTNLFEDGKNKCEMYWPMEVGQISTHGRVKIKMIEENAFADYVIRQLDVNRVDPSSSSSTSSTPAHFANARRIQMFHFTSWPDQGVPQSPMSMAAFINVVRQKAITPQTRADIKITVHCSAGVGRTGTFIALWNLLDEAWSTEKVDIMDTVRHMRELRFKMVQTPDQYVFIYQALAVAWKQELQPIKTDEFQAALTSTACRPSRVARKLLPSLECLTNVLQKHRETRMSSLPENAGKNRVGLEGPFFHDDAKAHVITFLPPDGDSYINAGFADSHFRQNAFLMTQAPLEATLNAFWTVVWDNKPEIIVMLNQGEGGGEGGGGGATSGPGAPDYWPQAAGVDNVEETTKTRFGVVEVEVKRVAKDDKKQLTKRVLKISPVNKAPGGEGEYHADDFDEALTLTQFQVDFWPDDASVPDNPHLLYELLQEATRVLRSQRRTGNDNSSPTKVIVHCLDACGKSGVFVACCNLMLLMDEEELVNVPHCVMNVRDSIADAVAEEKQLKLLFEIAKIHGETDYVYINF